MRIKELSIMEIHLSNQEQSLLFCFLLEQLNSMVTITGHLESLNSIVCEIKPEPVQLVFLNLSRNFCYDCPLVFQLSYLLEKFQ